MTFQFNPTTGYRDKGVFPTTPASEDAFRDAMMTPLDQLRDEINSGANSAAGVQNLARQALINGGFDVAQRGSGLTVKDYVIDRWRWLNDGSGATFLQTQGIFIPGDSRVPGNPRHFYQATQGGTPVGQTFNAIVQRIENAALFAGGQATFSVYIETVSPGKQIQFRLTQNFGTGGSPSSPVTVAGTSFSAAGSFTLYQQTFTLPSVTGKTFGTNGDDYLEMAIFLPNNDTFVFNMANAQLNAGPVALPFQSKSFTQELQACQRYYEKSYNYGNSPGSATVIGRALINKNPVDASFYGTVPFKTQKRLPPTLVTYNTSGAIFSLTGITGQQNQIEVNSAASTPLLDFQWTADAEL